MNTTRNPHKGGVPKGHSWTKAASWYAEYGSRWGRTSIRREYFRLAAEVIQLHSRKPETRAEAARVLDLLARPS